MAFEFIFLLRWCGPLHLTWPARAMWHVHAPTFNKWHHKKKEKVTLHILTHGAMRGCGLTSLVAYVYDKICDVRERNVTIRSEIWTTNLRSLGFQNIREWVILWRLILRSLGCTYMYEYMLAIMQRVLWTAPSLNTVWNSRKTISPQDMHNGQDIYLTPPLNSHTHLAPFCSACLYSTGSGEECSSCFFMHHKLCEKLMVLPRSSNAILTAVASWNGGGWMRR